MSEPGDSAPHLLLGPMLRYAGTESATFWVETSAPCEVEILGHRTSTFTVEGKQYVAVMSGWGGDARGVQARLNAIRPGEFPEVPDGGAIWVFALPDRR